MNMTVIAGSTLLCALLHCASNPHAWPVRLVVRATEPTPPESPIVLLGLLLWACSVLFLTLASRG